MEILQKKEEKNLYKILESIPKKLQIINALIEYMAG